MNPADNSRKKQVITAVAVLIAITLIVVAAAAATTKKSDTTANSSADTSQTTSGSSATGTNVDTGSTETGNSATYNDGTYSASANYQSPGGTESVSVKITLAGGVVTASDVTAKATDNEAEEYQNMFLSGYKTQVVGKSVDSINLDRVSGSSLTSNGFNSALEKIKRQAQS